MALKDAAPIWDDQGFVARCITAAHRNGWSAKDLCRRAGIAGNYLVRTPAHGRNIEAVLRLAMTAEVPASWLLNVPACSDDVAKLTAKFAREVVLGFLADHQDIVKKYKAEYKDQFGNKPMPDGLDNEMIQILLRYMAATCITEPPSLESAKATPDNTQGSARLATQVRSVKPKNEVV